MNTNYAQELKQSIYINTNFSIFFSQISYIQVKYICCTGIFYRDACLAIPSDHRNDTINTLLYTINISKTYIMDVSKTSFVRYGCLKNPFLCHGCLQRHLLYVMDVSKTSFIRYEYPETNSETACVHQVKKSILKQFIFRGKSISFHYQFIIEKMFEEVRRREKKCRNFRF